MHIHLLAVPSVHLPFFGTMAKSIRPEQAVFLIDEQGFNVNATDSENWTPSHFACAYGNSGLLNTLLERGALPEAQTERGWRPLHFAAQGGYLSCIELLVGYKARVTCATKGCRSTPLHLAANSGLETVCERLLNEGADPEARDMLERTPLHLAAEQGHVGAVRALLDGGADVFVSDHDKWVPRQIAEFRGFMEVADVLAKAEEKGNRAMFGGSLYLPTDSWNVEIFAQVREGVARQQKLRSIDAERDAAYARCVDAYKKMFEET